MSDTTELPTTFTEAESFLAESLPGYESRPPQQLLASKVEKAIESRTGLIGLAGTGTGKSLGYLIPSILSGQRVIVSTGTKALQDQIAEKDLPFLQEHLPNKFNFALLKGRSNYLCKAALAEVEGETNPEVNEVRVFLKSKDDISGERDSIPEVSDSTWGQITTSSDNCPGAKACPFGEKCFSERAKSKAARSDIVVVNHALLCTDILTGGAVLGSKGALVVDECHELNSVAGNILGARITFNSVKDYTARAQKFGLSVRLIGEVLGAFETLFDVVTEGKVLVSQLVEQEDIWVEAINLLSELVTRVASVDVEGESDKRKGTKAILVRRGESLLTKLVDFATGDPDELIRWVEVGKSKRGTEFKILRSAPVDVGPLLAENLWNGTPGILVSATVGEFPFAAHEVGFDRSDRPYDTVDVGTPFDYPRQARLYVPERLPIKDSPTRDALVADEIEAIINASGGRTLVLFTSVKRLREAVAAVRPRVPYTLLAQGELPNKVLAERFSQDITSCLFATKSFFTGVDFQGETCTTVILDRIPFSVPTEPITEAKVAKLEKEGKSGFAHYSIPTASIVLQQALGRLIRTSSDRGIAAVLDARLAGANCKPYGRRLVKDLPPIPVIHELEEAAAFLQGSPS